MKTKCFFLILFCFYVISTAQSYNAIPQVSVQFHYGYIMNHAPSVAHLANQNMPGLEIEYLAQTRGLKKWQQLYRYPTQGISLVMFRYDPAKPIGHNMAIVPHFGKRILGNSNVGIRYKTGLGIGITQKPYDAASNRENNMLSTPLNYCLYGQLQLYAKLTPYVNLQMGAGVVHLSNGSWRKPNQGINQISAHVGIAYVLSRDTARKRETIEPHSHSHHVSVMISGGAKQHAEGYNRTSIAHGNVSYMLDASRKSTLVVGVDFMYDPGKQNLLASRGDNITRSPNEFWQIGGVIGHELRVNKVGMVVQYGIYVYDPLSLNAATYQRYGLRYYWSRHLFMGLAMKAHSGTADWVEYGVGIKI